MTSQNEIDYRRVEEAIHYIIANLKNQPVLEEIAANVHVSPFHFQRIFKEWAGISPGKFLQFISVRHATALLKKGVCPAAYETGLSSAGTLHGMFVSVEAMTPGEVKNGGAGVAVVYEIFETRFGRMLAGSTGRGICHAAFAEHDATALSVLQAKFPAARLSRGCDACISVLRNILAGSYPLEALKLHINGTPFQLKVWEALLQIPVGRLATYSAIAENIGQPTASRAVGTAVGQNPVAFLIPCHRVIRATGVIGEYMWGAARKAAIIGWEIAQTERDATRTTDGMLSETIA